MIIKQITFPVVRPVQEMQQTPVLLLRCWWECKLVPPLRRTVWRFLKNWRQMPYDSAIPLLGIHTEET